MYLTMRSFNFNFLIEKLIFSIADCSNEVEELHILKSSSALRSAFGIILRECRKSINERVCNTFLDSFVFSDDK